MNYELTGDTKEDKQTLDSIVGELPSPLESLTSGSSAVYYIEHNIATQERHVICDNEEFFTDFYEAFFNIAMTYARRIDEIGVSRITRSVLNPSSWLPKLGFRQIKKEYESAVESLIELRLDLYNRGVYEKSPIQEVTPTPVANEPVSETVKKEDKTEEPPQVPRLDLSLD